MVKAVGEMDGALPGVLRLQGNALGLAGAAQVLAAVAAGRAREVEVDLSANRLLARSGLPPTVEKAAALLRKAPAPVTLSP